MSDKILDEKLICDVMLPPATIIKRGCDLRTLLAAINQRSKFPPAQRVLRDAALARQPATVAVPDAYALLKSLERVHAGHMVGHDQSDQPKGGYSNGYVNGFGACIESAKRIIAAPAAPAPAAQEPTAWTRVDDRKPSEDAEVIVSGWAYNDPERGRYVTHAEFSDDLFKPVGAADEYGTLHPPTHWMPLPAAPDDTAPLAAEQPDSTTSDKYRAELYDEVWEKARSMGYGNVTMALAELERRQAVEQPPSDKWKRMDPTVVVEYLRRSSVFDADMIEEMLSFAIKAAELTDPVKVPRELLRRICADSEHAEMMILDRGKAIDELRALLGKEGA